MRTKSTAIDTLYKLTEDDSTFVLHRRVCWGQRMNREHLLPALTFLKVIGALHSHLGPGLSNQWYELGRGVQVTHDRVGRNILRENIRTFFDLIDAAWGIKVVTFKEGATHLRQTFMTTLALLLCRHTNFWKELHLFVNRDLIRKIAQFPVNDPEVKNLSSAGGQAGKILYQLLLEHINSGKRTGRLVGRMETSGQAEERREVSQIINAGVLDGNGE